MSPDELGAAAAWLRGLTGETCPWPIETAHDLREWALNIDSSRFHEDQLTGAELRAVRELIDKLEPPEEKTRRAQREKKIKSKLPVLDPGNLASLMAYCDALLAPSKKLASLQLIGTAARKRKGEPTREAVVRKFNNLKNCPERERAGIIARSIGITPQYVRRILKQAGLK